MPPPKTTKEKTRMIIKDNSKVKLSEDNNYYLYQGVAYVRVSHLIKLAGLSEFDTDKMSLRQLDVIEERAKFGRASHKLIELYEDKDLEEYDPKLEPILTGWKRFKKDCGIKKVVAKELVVAHPLGYGGRLDLVAIDKSGHKVLIDIKTGSVIQRSVYAQLGCYASAYNLDAKKTATRIMAVYLRPDLPLNYDVKELNSKDMDMASKMPVVLMGNFLYRRRYGYDIT
jgi:hypothetical protein